MYHCTPLGTRYSSLDNINNLSEELLNYDSNDYYYLLCCDLNAHTQEKNDFIKFNKHIQDELDLDDISVQSPHNFHQMNNFNIPLKRYSVDTKTDKGNYGNALIDLCKNHLMCIANGRVGSGRGVGKATTTDNSVIDYVITSPYILSRSESFIIQEFDPIFSDKHCIIEFSINVTNTGTPPGYQLLYPEPHV